jgi:hypothetical protein
MNTIIHLKNAFFLKNEVALEAVRDLDQEVVHITQLTNQKTENKKKKDKVVNQNMTKIILKIVII